MSGLVGYGSSDEDEDERNDQKIAEPKKPETVTEKITNAPKQETWPQNTATDGVTPAADVTNADVPQGPAAGPSAAPQDDSNQLLEDQGYESEKTTIMNLTLPPVPNFDIPPSPPGSPDPSVVDKLAQFAKLKKQGVHFNEKLANSTAIKNPNLFSKLMDSFGISEEKQYATTLPLSLWDPTAFPEWAYKEGLAKAQAEANQQRRNIGSDKSRLADKFEPASDKR